MVRIRDFDEETYEHLSSRRRQELDSLRSIAILRKLGRFTLVSSFGFISVVAFYSLIKYLLFVPDTENRKYDETATRKQS